MPVGLVRGYTRHLTPVSPSAARTDPLDRGLVGEWRFDPSTGLVLPDYGGRENHGTITNGAWIATNHGPALAFDGNDYVNCGDTTVLDGLPGLSVEIFTRPRTPDNVDYLANRYDGDLGIYLALFVPPTEVFFGVDDRVGGDRYGRTADGSFTNNAWHHVLGVFDGTGAADADKLKIYIDSDQKTLAFVGDPMPAATPTVTADLVFGRRESAADRYYNGEIALVRLYNRALSAAEVRARQQICLKRAQPMTHVWMIPFASVTAPPATIVPVAMHHYRRRRV